MAEKPLPGFETGSDRFFSGGKVLSKGTWGFELKNIGYSCKCDDVANFPKHIQTVNNAMAPVWKKYGLSGALSDEIRIHKGQPYCVDLTPRFGSPPGEIISRLYKNISEIIWKCAGGEEVTPEPIAKYACSINIKTHEAVLGDVPLTVKEKDLDRVMLKCACRIGNQFYNILNPMDDDDEEVATAIGFGDTIEEAQMECLDNAGKIDAPGITFPADCFDKLDEVLEEAEKNGLGKF
jgi:phosphoribosylamine-glycine ligase